MYRIKQVSILLISSLFLSLGAVAVAASPAVNVRVDNDYVAFPDVQPFVDDNYRTMVPIRFVREELGANVEWEGSTQTVRITKGNTVVVFKLGESKYQINRTEKTMDTKVVTKDGTIFVPLRVIGESFNGMVFWDKENNAAAIVQEYKPSIKADSSKSLETVASELITLQLEDQKSDKYPANYRLKDYKISEIKIVETNPKDFNGFEFCVKFSMLPLNPDQYIIGDNGEKQANGWINDKTLFVNVVKGADSYTLDGFSTGG